MHHSHTPENFELLKAMTVPTLANAVETYNEIPASTGFCDATMIDRFPDMPMLVGYAATCRVQTDLPATAAQPGIHEYTFWDYVAAMPEPKVVVCQDVDKPAVGANWGEFYANVYKALGCSGAIVDGAVRDLDGVSELGFRFFSTEVLPSHGNGHYIDYGGPVRVAGLQVHSGDLLVADRHGVLFVPASIPLDELIEIGRTIDSLEQEVFALCQSKTFSLEKLKALDSSVIERWPNPTSVTETKGPAIR